MGNIQHWIGIVLGVGAYATISLGQVLQKFSLQRKDGLQRASNKFFLLAGYVLAVVGNVVLLQANAYTDAAVVGAMSGIAIVVLVLLSNFLLKEDLALKVFHGLFFIMVGTTLMGFFSVGHPDILIQQDKINVLWIFFGVCNLLCFFLFASVSLFHHSKGALLGVSAGILAGLQVVAQKMVVGVGGTFHILQMAHVAMAFRSIYFYLFLLFSGASWVLLLFAYQYGDAIVILPNFASFMMLIPAIASHFIFQNVLSVPQWIAIAMIIWGVFHISHKHFLHQQRELKWKAKHKRKNLY